VRKSLAWAQLLLGVVICARAATVSPMWPVLVCGGAFIGLGLLGLRRA